MRRSSLVLPFAKAGSGSGGFASGSHMYTTEFCAAAKAVTCAKWSGRTKVIYTCQYRGKLWWTVDNFPPDPTAAALFRWEKYDWRKYNRAIN